MRLLRFVFVVGLLGALAAGIVLETPALYARSGARDVDRVRGYDVTPGAGPAFALPGGDGLLRLVTNAIVPAELGGEDSAYAILVEIAHPDGTVDTRPIHLKSHRTGARFGIDDPCFDRDGTPIADGRHVDLVLDPPAAPGTLVRVTGLGDTPSVVRAWSWQPREGAERARRRLALDTEGRRRLGEPLGVLSWDHLTDAERARWTTGHFARLSANGRPGVEHVSHDLLVRAVQPEEVDAAALPTRIASPLTWLANGPTVATISVASTPLTAPATLELRRVAVDTEVLGRWDVGPGAEAHTWSGTLPEGPQTLVLTSSAPTDIALAARLPGTAAVPPLPSADPVDVPPATITLRATPVGPGQEAVLDAELPADVRVRTVEIEVWSAAAVDPALTVTVHGARQDAVDVVRPVLAANPYDVVVDAYGAETPLRGPARVKLLLPADADEVHVAADTAAFLRFRVPFHLSDADPGPPDPLRRIGLDDAPAARSWVRPTRPTEEVAIAVKPRVEPAPPPAPPPTWLAVSLDPSGLVQRFEALERVAGELTGRLLTEVTGGLVRLRAGAGQTRARWSFEVLDDALLGTSVPFSLDGQPAGTIRAALTRGTVRLPTLAPGEHTVEAHPPPGLRLFVNLPPAASERAASYRARTVWRVSQPVRVSVRTDGRGPRALNIVVYHPSTGPRDDVSLVATVDGGAPRRREHGTYERSTPSRRAWTLPAAAHPDAAVLVDGDRASIGLPRTVIVPLGDDLLPGLHTVLIQANTSLYMRFFAVTPPGLATETPSQPWDLEGADE